MYANSPKFLSGTLAGALLCVGASSACGRVGLELMPIEKSRDAGDDLTDSGGGGDGDDPEPCVAISDSDATCDGVDDDCDGTRDEDYAVADTSPCGVGSCRDRSVVAHCDVGGLLACQPGAPLAANDATADGVDDDCDGAVDEDTCMARSETYGAGSHVLARGGCGTLSVKLWGAAGSSGEKGGNWGLGINNGAGGAGGFVQGTFSVASVGTLRLDVGQGGQGCTAAGTNANPAYAGGAGGSAHNDPGAPGADGTVAGAAGGDANPGGDGAQGFFGGGGGGAGATPPWDGPYGKGGGGGAASVLTLDAQRVIAGGGGGGGGVGADVTTAGHSGGAGGSGCGGAGTVADNTGGGGGGGGVCQGGSATQVGTGRVPFDPAAELPAGAALGGDTSAECMAGGDGWAIVTYGP
ncbi:MAG: hypothetical protein QM778_12385 [Myxococcales bacterium]